MFGRYGVFALACIDVIGQGAILVVYTLELGLDGKDDDV